MDIKRGLYVFGGLSVGLGLAAIYSYLKQSNQFKDASQLREEFQTLLQAIHDYFQINNDKSKLGELLENRDQHVQMLQILFEGFVDENRLMQELSQLNYLEELQLVNAKEVQQKILNVDVIASYLKSSSYENVQNLVESQHKGIALKEFILQDYQFHSLNTLKFIFYAFLVVIVDMEQVLIDKEKKSKLVEINYYISALLDWLEQLLSQNKNAAHLVSIALLLPINQYDNIEIFSRRDDIYYAHPISKQEQPSTCDLKLLDLMLRFSSLITPTLQKKFVSLLIQYQIINTNEQLTELTQLCLKNSFYLGSQLQLDSMYYLPEASILQILLLQGITYREIRNQLCQNHPNTIDVLLLFIERVLNQNKPQFWAVVLKSLIVQHIILYPLFSDQDAQSRLLNTDSKLFTCIVHFFGVLLIFESRETYEVNQGHKDNSHMMDWLAQNMDNMLATDVLSSMQLPFFREIMRLQIHKASPERGDSIKQELFKTFLQCLRVVQNNRIRMKTENRKMVDINVSLTKVLGYLVLGCVTQLPDKKAIKNVVSKFPFQDKKEFQNIFSNILRILFDLPSMNLHFLRYISPRCEKISQDALNSFNGYYTHIISSQTLSFDLYMMTMQIGFLLGKQLLNNVKQYILRPETLLKEVQARLYRDLDQFEQFKEFLLRDLIVLVDLMENEYYFYNIMNHLQLFAFDEDTKLKFNKKWVYLQQRATVSIMQLNQQLNKNQLHETLKLFMNHRDDQYETAYQVLEAGSLPNTIKLKQTMKDNYPILSLQKDMESITIYFQMVEQCVQNGQNIDLFDELLNNNIDLEYLLELRLKMFLYPTVQEIISDCFLKSEVARTTFYPWITKLLYYGTQVYAYCKRTSYKNEKKALQVQSLLKILHSQDTLNFVKFLQTKKQCQSFVNYYEQWLIQN